MTDKSTIYYKSLKIDNRNAILFTIVGIEA